MPSAALPGVTGQVKSPPPYDNFQRERLTQTRQRFNQTPGQCWPCSGLLREENLNVQVAFSVTGQGGESQWSFLVHSRVLSQGLRNVTALQSKGQQVRGEAQARRPPSNESACTNHFRRRRPRGSCEAHEGQTGLLYSRPGRKEPHTSWRSVYLQLPLGSNTIRIHSQEHG